jgi:hypothetical protein
MDRDAAEVMKLFGLEPTQEALDEIYSRMNRRRIALDRISDDLIESFRLWLKHADESDAPSQ